MLLLWFFVIFATSYGDDFSVIDIPLLEEYQSKYDIKAICLNFTNKDGVTDSCKQQLNVVCNNLTLLLTMFDATSKFPYSGLVYSTRMDFGNFDECVKIEHVEKYKNDSTRILGKYCSPGFIIPVINNESDASAVYQNSFKLSLCIPDKCSAADLQNISALPLFVDEGCTTKESDKLTPGDIIIFIVFVILLCTIIVSTLYDIVLYKMRQEAPSPIFISFSLFSNAKKLFHTNKYSKEQILVFHGLKCLSMWWIIAGHTYLGWTGVPLINEKDALTWLDHLYTFYISSAYLAVDTFFYISGFLFAYQYLKTESKSVKQQIKNVPMLYVHRYLRLTPALLMTYLFLIGILIHIVHGPMNYMIDKMFIDICYTNWWSVFLYVQNYHSPENWCMVNTWYLCADMQMFLLTPLIAIPVATYIKTNFKKTMIALFCMNVFFTFLPLIHVIWQDLYYNEYATHSRLINYGIGFMMGTYMRQKKDLPFKMSQKTNFVIWITTISIMITIILVYKVIDINYDVVAHQVFFSLMRPTWCTCLCWIVYSCYHGYGGLVNWLLSLPSFQIGSRLSYSMYLVHVPLMAIYIANTKEKKYFSDYNAFYEWCGHLIMTLVVSLVWVLAFESPMIVIEKFIFGGPSSTRRLVLNGREVKNQRSKEMSLNE